MKKNKGFTLIELLAVIVILAVLMVIAVPKILDVIESSRTSAAASSIKLIKDGIKTNVAAAELTTNPYTKTDGCYVFDFDTPNENVNNLTIENKEKTGGSIKLCDGKFEDDTLTFDGNTNVQEVTTVQEVEPLVGNYSSNVTCYDCWFSQGDGFINLSASYGNTKVSATYKDKIVVKAKEKYKIKAKIGLWHNYTEGYVLGTTYIGLSTTNEQTTSDYVTYENFDITSRTEDIKNVELTITTPGEYYLKIYMNHAAYDSNSVMTYIRDLSIEKTTRN